jgi:acyl-CoA synthetase (AMP-forming)/AMP-acid ligase II
VRHEPTHALLVPTVIHRMLDAAALDVASLTNLMYGAAPMNVALLHRVLAERPDLRLCNTYGQTEGAPITALSPADHRDAGVGRPELLETVGRAVPGLDLAIAEPGTDGVGEVLARADHLMNPDTDGWLHTGDLGTLDADGYLRLVGRRQDKIIRGGENVLPLEVEQVLAGHPDVADAAVVGVPDAVYGEIVKAFVVASDPVRPPDFVALRAYARDVLAGFKVPTEWALVDELPRTAEGKLQRRRLPR